MNQCPHGDTGGCLACQMAFEAFREWLAINTLRFALANGYVSDERDTSEVHA